MFLSNLFAGTTSLFKAYREALQYVLALILYFSFLLRRTFKSCIRKSCCTCEYHHLGLVAFKIFFEKSKLIFAGVDSRYLSLLMRFCLCEAEYAITDLTSCFLMCHHRIARPSAR